MWLSGWKAVSGIPSSSFDHKSTPQPKPWTVWLRELESPSGMKVTCKKSPQLAKGLTKGKGSSTDPDSLTSSPTIAKGVISPIIFVLQVSTNKVPPSSEGEGLFPKLMGDTESKRQDTDYCECNTSPTHFITEIYFSTGLKEWDSCFPSQSLPENRLI